MERGFPALWGQIIPLVLIVVAFLVLGWWAHETEKDYEEEERARRELLMRRVRVVPLPCDEDDEGLFWLWAAGLMDEEGSV